MSQGPSSLSTVVSRPHSPSIQSAPSFGSAFARFPLVALVLGFLAGRTALRTTTTVPLPSNSQTVERRAQPPQSLDDPSCTTLLSNNSNTTGVVALSSSSLCPSHVPSHTTEATTTAARSLGIWMGNWWIPPAPDWGLYSPAELHDFYRGTRWLIWDGVTTTSSSSTATLVTLFNTTSRWRDTAEAPFSISLRQLQQPINFSNELCTSLLQPMLQNNNESHRLLADNDNKGNPTNKYQEDMQCCKLSGLAIHPGNVAASAANQNVANNNTGSARDSDIPFLVDLPVTCPADLMEILEWELDPLRIDWKWTAHTDLLVIQMGSWQDDDACPTTSTDASDTTETTIRVLVQRMQQLLEIQPHLTIVWQTSPYGVKPENNNNNDISESQPRWNQLLVQAMDQLPQPSRLVVVDWAAALRGRSNEGNPGWQAHLVFVQIMTHHLAQQGWKPQAQ